MATIDVHAASHTLVMDRVRGRGAPGGWRWMPGCNCGWNRYAVMGRSPWPRSFISETDAYQEFLLHVAESNSLDMYVVDLATGPLSWP